MPSDLVTVLNFYPGDCPIGKLSLHGRFILTTEADRTPEKIMAVTAIDEKNGEVYYANLIDPQNTGKMPGGELVTPVLSFANIQVIKD